MELTSLLVLFISSVLALSHSTIGLETSHLEPAIEKLKGLLKNAEEKPTEDGESYYTSDVIPPVYVTGNVEESDVPDKRGTLFRYGKRGSIFRFGKRGYVFRYGRGRDEGFNDGLDEGYGTRLDDKRAIFRYGKRGARLHAPFRFGKSLEQESRKR